MPTCHLIMNMLVDAIRTIPDILISMCELYRSSSVLRGSSPYYALLLHAILILVVHSSGLMLAPLAVTKGRWTVSHLSTHT